MFKNIILTVFTLITNPGTAWRDLSTQGAEESRESFLKRMVYPMLGVTVLVIFVCSMWSQRKFDDTFSQDVQDSLKEVIVVLASYFLGFYFALFVFEKGLSRFFPEMEDRMKTFRFIGYNLCVLMAISIVVFLIDFTFLQFAPLYIAYVIWESAREYWGITDDNKRMTFVGATTLVMIGSPWIIRKLLFIMIH